MPNQALQTPSIEQWLAQVSLTAKAQRLNIAIPPLEKQDSKSLAAQLLSYFGLKNPTDLATLLKSPAGNSIKDRVSEQLAEIQAAAFNQKKLLREEAYKEHLKLAFLVLGLMHYREVKAEQMEQLIEKDIERRLHQHKNENHIEEELKASHKCYLEAELALLDAVSHHKNQVFKLTDALDLLSQKQIMTNARYELFEESLATLAPEEDEVHLFLKGKHQDIHKFTQNLKNKLSDLNQKISKDAEKVGLHLEQGHDEKAQKLLTKTNARNLMLANLNDMLEVIHGAKYLCTETGESASSFPEATFVLEKNQKIVKNGERNYLLKADENLNDLTFERKHQAELAFHKLKPEITCIQSMVKDNRHQEQHHYHEQTVDLEKQKHKVEHQLDSIKNQLTKIQFSKNLVENQLNRMQQQESHERATLKPKLSPLLSKPKKEQEIEKKYKTTIEKCFDNKKCLPEPVIADLKSYLSKIDNPQLRKQLQGLSTERPLTPQEMKALLSLNIPGDGKERVLQLMHTYGLPDASPFRIQPKPPRSS